jgi:hypothetical protein
MNAVKEAATKFTVRIAREIVPADGKSFIEGEFSRTGLLIAASELLSWQQKCCSEWQPVTCGSATKRD